MTIFFLIVLVANDPAKAESNVVIDFEGLEAGTFVQSVSYGQGIHGMPVDGSITVYGRNILFPTENAAMTFDATCPGGCSGFDYDLFAPEQGMVLIVSQDMDASYPNDADFAVTQELSFQDLATGKVTVDSLTIGDIDPYEEGGMPEFYAGGSDGTLLDSAPIPVTGNNVYKSLPIGVSGVDYMRVSLKGSGAIDNILLSIKSMEEVLYLSDTVVKYDGISNLYRVEIEEVNARANLILLPNGLVDYDHVDSLASTPDGSRLYFVDEDTRDPDSLSILAYYDHGTATLQEIGNIQVGGEQVRGIDQAAFSPDGVLYLTGSELDKLYTVDLVDAEATEIGTLVNESTSAVLNIDGADIAYTAQGALYLWINFEREGAPIGLYTLSLPAQDGSVLATYLGAGSDDHLFRGLAFRANGIGDLVGSTRENELHIMNLVDGSDVLPPLPLYLEDEPFDTAAGDMSIGPFAEVAVSSR